MELQFGARWRFTRYGTPQIDAAAPGTPPTTTTSMRPPYSRGLEWAQWRLVVARPESRRMADRGIKRVPVTTPL